MFCCIDFLKRGARGKNRVAATRYKTAAGLGAMKEFAERECRMLGAVGYRLHDLHSDEIISEIWD